MELDTNERKAKLMRNLEKVRTINHALQFCSLLIKAQKLEIGQMDKEGNFCSLCKDHSKDYEDIITSLQKILVSSEPGEIVKIVCRALCAPKENNFREGQQLKIVLESKCGEGTAKYFNQLIGTVESLVESLAFPALFQKTLNLQEKDRGKRIVSLEEFIIAYGTRKIEKVFAGFFFYTLKYLHLNLSEVKEIGDLMIMARPNMDLLIKRYCFKSKSFVGIIKLQIRSALQSLIELLVNCSDEYFCGETWKELIHSLGKVIKKVDRLAPWTRMSDSYENVSCMDDSKLCGDFLNETLEDYYRAGARSVPEEHTWWLKYKKFFL